MKLYKPKYTRNGETREASVWWVRFTIDGVRRFASTGMTTAKAAHTRAVEILRDAELARAGIQTFADSRRSDIDDLVLDYEAELRRRRRTPTHIKKAAAGIRALVSAARAQTLADLSAPRIEAALGTLGNLAARTQNLHRVYLSAFFAWLEKTGRWAENPCKRVAVVREREPKKRRRALTPHELRALLEVAPRDRRLVYLVAATTGMRVGELRAVESEDVDFDGGTVTVRAKNAKNALEATLPLTAAAATAWRAWLAERAANTADRVRRKQRPLEARFFPRVPNLKSLYRDLAAAGIERRTPDGDIDLHSLRVTYCTNLARAGVSLQQAQRLMRHSTPLLTTRHYVRLEMHDGRTAAAALDLLLAEPAEPAAAPRARAEAE